MPNPPLRSDFVDVRAPEPHELPAAEYNLNAQRTDYAYDTADAAVAAAGAAQSTANDATVAAAAAQSSANAANTNKVDKSASVKTVYAVTAAGNQSNIPYADAATPATIVQRDANGTFQVGAPSHNNHPARKVDLDGKQPIDADLTAIAALAPADDAIIQRKGGAWVARTPAQLKVDLAAAVAVPVWFEIHATYGVRAVGYGDNTMGMLVPDAFTLTGVVFRGETADGSGSSTFELRRNGVAVAGTSKVIDSVNQWTYDTDIVVSGLAVNLAAGDIMRPYISAIGTTPGRGFSAVLIGTKAVAVV